MFRQKIMPATASVLNCFAKLVSFMFLFWFVVPICAGILEQVLREDPTKIAELILPALLTPFLLWHRLVFLFSEYCFHPDPGSAAGNVPGIMILIWSAVVHIGCLVLTVLFSIKPKPVYWLPLAVILALGSIHMADIFAMMCGV